MCRNCNLLIYVVMDFIVFYHKYVGCHIILAFLCNQGYWELAHHSCNKYPKRYNIPLQRHTQILQTFPDRREKKNWSFYNKDGYGHTY